MNQTPPEPPSKAMKPTANGHGGGVDGGDGIGESETIRNRARNPRRLSYQQTFRRMTTTMTQLFRLRAGLVAQVLLGAQLELSAQVQLGNCYLFRIANVQLGGQV